MTESNLFCVTDCWTNYQVVRATNANSAVHKVFYKKNYKLIPSNKLTDQTVIHVTCCPYVGVNRERIDSCSNDIDRILLIDILFDTKHYQIS